MNASGKLSVVLLCYACFVSAGSAQSQDPPTTNAPASGGIESMRMICEEITVAAPVEDVWRAWTTTEGVKSFFSDNAEIELKLGGKFEVYFLMEAPEGSRGSEGCQVLAWLPNKMLTFTWNAPPMFPNVRKERTQVVLLFDLLAPNRTRVRLTQHGWGTGEEWDQVFDYFSKAWPRVLQNLKSSLEGSKKAAEGASESKTQMKQWLCLVRPPRESFMQDMTEEEEAKITEHYHRLIRLLEEGTLILAGPALDGKGPGIIVFQAEDEAKAREIVENDPAIRAGIFSAELHPYRVSLLHGQ